MSDVTISLLFWNIQKKNITQNAVRLVQHYGANILLLTEANPKQDTEGLLHALNQALMPSEKKFLPIEWKEKPKTATAMTNLLVVTNLEPNVWEQCIVRNRYAIWALSLPGRQRFHLIVAHFPGIQQDQGDKQRESAIALRRDLESVEDMALKPGEKKLSVIIGDMNANPFDAGITGVYGLNATHLKEVADRQFRTANGQRHSYLFNPMWRFLGAAPWGTFYYDGSNPIRYDWSILDQVLVRPEMMQYFDKRDVPDVWIPITDGVVDLNPGVLDKDTAMPDHRPIFFRFVLPPVADTKETA